jgi:hypothetical protein
MLVRQPTQVCKIPSEAHTGYLGMLAKASQSYSWALPQTKEFLPVCLKKVHATALFCCITAAAWALQAA